MLIDIQAVIICAERA